MDLLHELKAEEADQEASDVGDGAATADLLRRAIAEIKRLQAEIDRRTGKRRDCQVCGEEVPFVGAVFCSVACCKAAEKAKEEG